jgi:SecD/SecF fusion protein
MEINNPEYLIGSARRFNSWDVKLALPAAEAEKVFNHLETTTNSQPVFPLANKIGGRVADDLRTKAIAAIIVSFIGIIAYVWFRFHGWIYGVAAVIAIIHDVLITVGFLAMSAWLVQSVPGLATALMVEKFQISLPVVASLLTIIGYSLNDTIVVFDRIREVKGKSPKLTSEMINQSVNETLSRTLLTSSTTILSVIVLYIMGGEGIHGFTFALVIGIIVGTYSSVFIASPILLWLSHADQGSPASALSQSSVGTRDLAATK